MRIAIDATPVCASEITGVGRYVLTLLKGLAARPEGKDVLVVFSDPEVLPLLGEHPFEVHYLKVPTSLGPLAREVSLQYSLRNLCRTERIDVLHTTLDPVWPMPWTRQVMTLHDVARIDRQATGLFVSTLRGRVRTIIRYRLARRTDHILTVSGFSKDRIVSLLGIRQEAISVVHTGQTGTFGATHSPGDAKDFLARQGLLKEYILFVGQLGRQKNETGLVSAWRILKKKGLDVDLVLVGNGTLNVEKPSGMHVLEHVSDQDLASLYAGAGVFCLPSFSEGFGLPVMEAMESGLPVVVSRGTCLEEVAGEAAILVDPSDLRSIADGLAQALDPDLNRAYRERSADRAKWFSLDRMTSETLAVYREVADE